MGIQLAMDEKPRVWEWGIVILLFLALRMGGLLLFHPFFSNICPLEEYYRGTLGHEILQGLSMPYGDYRADDSGGGSLVMGILAAGFFKLFGSSAFVLKTIPVLISLGALLIWFGILYREFSRKCAWYFALFWIFAPSTFQSWSLVPLGDHYETILISALAVWIFLKIQRDQKGEEGIRGDKRGTEKENRALSYPFSSLLVPFYPFLLGVVCGFGVWFAYIFTLTVTALLIVWFRRNSRFIFTAAFWIFTLGFLIGFSPWVITNFQNGFQGLIIHGKHVLWHVEPFCALTRGGQHVWQITPFFDFFRVFGHAKLWRSQPEFFIHWFYMALLVLPALWLLVLKRRLPKNRAASKCASDVGLYFLIYAVVHALAVQATDFRNPRYFMPLMPAVFFAWARMMEFFSRLSPRLETMSRLFFVLPMMGMGALLWFSMISPIYGRYLLEIPGYAYDYIPRTPACVTGLISQGATLERHQLLLKKISEEDRRGILKSYAMERASFAAERGGPYAAREHFIHDLESAAAYYFQLGRFLLYYESNDLGNTEVKIESLLGKSSAMGHLALAGAVHSWGNQSPKSWPDPGDSVFIQTLPENAWRGYGEQYARMSLKSGKKIGELAQGLPGVWSPEVRRAFWEGAGMAFIQHTYEQPIVGLRQFQQAKTALNPEDLRSFYRGVGRLDQISLSFSIKSCETWESEYLLQETDSLILSWMEEGRMQIKSLIESFKKEIAAAAKESA